KSSEREERHIRYALRCKLVHKGIIVPLSDVEKVLDADDRSDLPRLRELPGRDIAQTEMTDQSLTLEVRKRGERFFNRSLRWFEHLAHAQIDHVELIQAEIPEVVMNRADQFLARKSVNPRLVGSPARAHFGDNHEPIWIRMERLLDDL